jgi:hypothetical protein
MVAFRTMTLRVDRKDISYIHYIMEGYDGLGIVSTDDPLLGRLTVAYPECRGRDMFDLIAAFRKEGVIKEVFGI